MTALTVDTFGLAWRAIIPRIATGGGPTTVHMVQLTESAPVQFQQSLALRPAKDGDFMCRVKVDSASEMAWVATVETRDFQALLHSTIAAKDRDIWRLKAVALWLKTRLDYQAVHTAYLMGSMSEEEFTRESERYSTENKSLDRHHIVTEIVEVSKLLNFELSPADYAEFLGVDLDDVLRVAPRLGLSGMTSTTGNDGTAEARPDLT